MAGEWLKMEACTPEKSEVLAITAKMGWDDTDLTVGKLFRIWRWFDQQTTDGNADSVTPALLDRIVGVTGFCFAMQSVGWLYIHEGGISLPNFDRHNGNTSKSRALTAKRVAKCKANASGNADTVTEALPREEKKREESSTDVEEKKPASRAPSVKRPDTVSEGVWADFLAIRKAKKAPLTQTAMDGIARQARKAHMSLQQALEVCCARGWQGFNADWVAKDIAPIRNQDQGETQYQRSMRERADAFAPLAARQAPAATPQDPLFDLDLVDVVQSTIPAITVVA